MTISLSIALERNRQMQQDLKQLARAIAKNSDELKQAEVAMGEMIVERVIPLTPIITGALRSAQALFVEGDNTLVALNRRAKNPTSKEDPYQYGPKVHEMGGLSQSGHVRAFYDEVLAQHGEEILDTGEDTFITSLEVFRNF